jgi:hypothetical protein
MCSSDAEDVSVSVAQIIRWIFIFMSSILQGWPWFNRYYGPGVIARRDKRGDPKSASSFVQHDKELKCRGCKMAGHLRKRKVETY